MPATQFKFIQTGPSSLTRRVTFAEEPTWLSLASRIESLYGIPIQDVGVSYIDTDGDEITLSTHEELLDYYATVPNIHKDVIKFVVKNIGSLRAQQRLAQSRFGDNLFDMGDEDWQGLNIPSLPRVAIIERSPPPPPPKSPSSAFVETVDSNYTAEQNPARSGTASPLMIVTGDEKGKAREQPQPKIEEEDVDDDSSIMSVIHSDMPVKQPVHVYDFDTEARFSHGLFGPRSPTGSYFTPRSPSGRPRSRSPSRSSTASPWTPPPPLLSGLRVMPRSRSISPPAYVYVPFSNQSVSPGSYAGRRLPSVRIMSPSDPPSPVLGPVPPVHAAGSLLTETPSNAGTSVSLSKDVAGLLNALTNAFGSHPELSEGLKNIVRNASQGAYWAADRDVMVNGAPRSAESAEGVAARAAQDSQDDAGRKVAEALGGVFRALGGLIGPSISAGIDQGSQQQSNITPQSRGRTMTPPQRSPPGFYDSPNMPNMSGPYREKYDHDHPWKGPGLFGCPFPPPPGSPPLGPPPPGPPPPGPPAPSHPPSPGPPPGHRPLPGHHHHHGPPPPPSPPCLPHLPGHHHHSGPPPLPGHHHHPGPPPLPGHHHHTGPPPLPGPHPGPHYPGPHYPGPQGPHHSGPPHLGPHHPPPGPPDHQFYGGFPPRMFAPMWGPGHHGLRRSSTLPGRFLGPRLGPDYSGVPLPPSGGPLPPLGGPLPPFGGQLSSSSRKAQLEEAKHYYKAKKEEWRREKEARKRAKEKREMDRARLRERLASGPIRLAMSMSSSDEEGSGTRPTVPVPLPEVINTSPPRASGNTDWPRPGPGHGSSRMDAQSQGTQKRVLMRLADMGFTPRTHKQLESLVAKQILSKPESGKESEDTIIARLLEDLFVTAPEASGSGVRPPMRQTGGIPIPGAWNN